MPTNQHNIIQASPTKHFFISMITRDLRISRAILDLVDNSVDAANASGEDLTKKEIKIYCYPDYFLIKDNCGGMKLNDATNYAFKFGRDEERQTPHSVGQFGVGMKRTLFKLGKKFKVESFNDEKLNIDVNIEEWLKAEEWHFTFNSNTDVAQGNTSIKSYDLHKDSVDAFSSPSFLNELKSEIESAHFKALRNGIQ
ncbi:ATP-binding protein, partial [Acinetobacter baumannii]|nr:ATP-binding protein [Acinetobacter baumannii]